MSKFKVEYVRTVTEIYEAIIEANTEEDAMDIVFQAKYGEPLNEEKLIESYSDEIDLNCIEEI